MLIGNHRHAIDRQASIQLTTVMLVLGLGLGLESLVLGLGFGLENEVLGLGLGLEAKSLDWPCGMWIQYCLLKC